MAMRACSIFERHYIPAYHKDQKKKALWEKCVADTINERDSITESLRKHGVFNEQKDAEINRSFKIIGRDKTTKRQKKTVYTSYDDYVKYKDDIIRRWTIYMKFNIETYELIEGDWVRLGYNDG